MYYYACEVTEFNYRQRWFIRGKNKKDARRRAKEFIEKQKEIDKQNNREDRIYEIWD